MSEESVYQMYDHLVQLIKIRKDELFRLNFIFAVKAQEFINIFSECHCRMFQFLSKLDKAAAQLDKMKKGSNISTVAGSSVGIAGGVLSIVGLALAPVTAGISLELTIAGVVLGATSGVNGIATGITETIFNNCRGKEANNTFISFLEDVQKILDCIETVARTEGPVVGPQGVTTAVDVGKLFVRAGAVVNSIDGIVDGVSAVKFLGTDEVIAKAVNLGLHEAKAGQSIPKLAADLPDVGQLAKGTPVALSQSARAGFIGLNAFFIGLDVLFIFKSGASLAKGSKSEVAQFICSRAALWRSEVEAWEKIHNHLFEGISGFNKNSKILDKPFHN
ncbi:apolipoprotein L2-like [Clarias gariepinus]